MFNDNHMVEQVQKIANEEGAEVVTVSNQIEEELAELNDLERSEFLENLGLEEAGLDRVIRAGYVVRLQQYFTAGPKEVRAWTILLERPRLMQLELFILILRKVLFVLKLSVTKIL